MKRSTLVKSPGETNFPVLKRMERRDLAVQSLTMKLRQQAKDTMESVTDASKTVINTTEWATVALITVSAVSLLALGIALIALGKNSRHA